MRILLIYKTLVELLFEQSYDSLIFIHVNVLPPKTTRHENTACKYSPAAAVQ